MQITYQYVYICIELKEEEKYRKYLFTLAT